ncbi:protein MLN51 homolog isoform X2 [Magnolia sinica]|uniref:protein MLN51 homolog isoform X2 n=1 Tax=Magnolia sinica TaxID=86752 RepID=UPI002657E56E|nr:protein MLN51 homolog isoform X2 [Magnolia sinica]
MAVEVGEEEAEYESDPEESVLPLAMRRREASDDEDGDAEEAGREKKPVARAGIASDGESDGQGGAPGYEDEESEIEEEEEEEEEEGEEVEEEEELEDEGGEFEVPEAAVEAVAVAESSGEAVAAGSRGKNQGAEEEKKESEPFAVPTAGAFYMHDDRFRENGGGRHRRTPGGRKLWESKDNREWVHDRFEEMNLQDAGYDEERRNSKGHFRGRGKYRGHDRGYVRGNRSRVYDDGNNQNRNFKSVRGRGPRRYEPPGKNNSVMSVTQNKQSGKILDTPSNASSGRAPAHTSNSQPDSFIPRKHVFASSLSSASPPFYPSGSSNQDISVTQKRDAQTGGTNRNLHSSAPIEENFSTSHSSTLLRGKNVVHPTGQDRPYMADSTRPVGGKPLNNLQLQSSGSSSPVNTTQSPQSRIQGRGLTISAQLNHQPSSSPNQVNRGFGQTQLPVVHQRAVQNAIQPALRASPQQLGQHAVGGTQASSPPQAQSINSSDVGEIESPPGSSKSKTALVGKGKASIQGSGRGSFLYSGAQVIGATGAMGVAHGDQNFPGTPALLPVMQFGGQHNGGLGVPAVGMALPGYVAQPQLGFGNSEMTWVPVLAGAAAAGALGATYCSPYIAVDGGYYGRPSGQTSLSGSKACK